jgi:protein-tyrosine phosphatase
MTGAEMTDVETNLSETKLRRHLPITGLHNLRDLGGYATADGLETRPGVIFRSDSPHRLTADGIAELERLGVTTVIDLRHAGELESAPNPFSNLPGYHHVSLFGGLSGDPSALGSLEALYAATLQDCGEALREVIETVADSDGGALVHCTAGKDRTGLVAALLLLLVGVAQDDVIADYALTATHAKSLLGELLEKTRAAGGDSERFARLLTAEPETMRATLNALHDQYGTARKYLEAIGVRAESLERLEARWLREQS